MEISENRTSRGLAVAVTVIALQVIAAGFFLVDAAQEAASAGNSLDWLEVLVAFALLAGIAYAGLAFRRLHHQSMRKDEALAIARGALGALLRERFVQWRLSDAEAEVALFALKGCTIGEIADLRGAAQGTVRSQLSRVYSKAGVNGQPMLMSLFLDDLLDERAALG